MARLCDCIGMMAEGIGRVGRLIPRMPADESRLCRLLMMLGGRLQETLEGWLKPHKLNHSEFITLMFLYGRPDGCSTPGELCDLTSQGATNMTRIGNALVERGLITRGPSSEDRRRVVVRITAAGRRFVERMLPSVFPLVDTAFAGFTAREKKQFDRLLLKLADNLDGLDQAPSPKEAR